MVEKAQQELITLKGKLKSRSEYEVSSNLASKFWNENGKLILKNSKSIPSDEFFSVPMEVLETEKNGQKISNQFESIMLVFWKKNFDVGTQLTIASLKESQNIVVHGYLGGTDNGLLRVVELETDSDIFI